jgi:hypothetical protein
MIALPDDAEARAKKRVARRLARREALQRLIALGLGTVTPPSVLAACGKSHGSAHSSTGRPVMADPRVASDGNMESEPLPSWPRRHFSPGGGDAHLFYKVHGTFNGEPTISRIDHRCAGIPEHCELHLYTRESHPDVLAIGLDDNWIGSELRRVQPSLARAVTATDQCLVLRGVVPDPANLDYFRDAVGLLMALLEGGGVAVFDPHMFKWWSADEWRNTAFNPASAVPRHHVVILVSDEPDGRSRWYHTRGMLKFGRPDLSVHNVTPELDAAVIDLCNRLIEMQAFGAVISEGQEIKMAGLPTGWRCHLAGDLDDPDFNNRHLDIGPG